jgi:hypothetical protein
VWGHSRQQGGGALLHQVIKFPRLDPGHVIGDFVMNHTSFDGRWERLTSLGFSIARADNGGDMYGGLMLDDVEYDVFG